MVELAVRSEMFFQIFSLLILILQGIESRVPPDICFERPRFDDCGQAPKPVMYYYKEGSRCEVGLWKGCLPNLNMFKDQYECVTTCIFGVRAEAFDYHNLNEFDVTEFTDYDETTTMLVNVTSNSTGNGTTPGKVKAEEGEGLAGDEPANEEPAGDNEEPIKEPDDAGS